MIIGRSAFLFSGACLASFYLAILPDVESVVRAIKQPNGLPYIIFVTKGTGRNRFKEQQTCILSRQASYAPNETESIVNGGWRINGCSYIEY